MIMKTIWEARKKFISFAAIALLVLLMMNMNSRLSEYFRLSGERDKLQTQVVELRATKMLLETQVAYATSDQAVEDWARREAHMARPGDKVIIPLTPVGVTPVPPEEVMPTPRVVQNWEIWWALFFSN
jgi:cell division protein FtsB